MGEVGLVVSRRATRVDEIERFTLRRPNFFGPGVVSLASGDPSSLVPETVVSQVRAATSRDNFGYTHPYGLPALRERLAEWIGARTGHSLSPGEVVVTHGASSGLAALALALLDPGDRVLLPSPTYSLYADVVRLAGGVPEYVRPSSHSFGLPLDELERRASAARMIIICNPCNPTGAVYPDDELRRLSEIADAHHVTVVSDEAYSSIVYVPTNFTSALSIANSAHETILVDTFSKRLCMTGLRLGYVAASAQTAATIARVHHTLLGPVATPIQVAVSDILADYDRYTDGLLETLTHRRDAVGDALAAVDDLSYRPPAGGFYAFFGVQGNSDSAALAQDIAKGGVAVRPGAEFGDGGEGYLRLAFCGPEEQLSEGLRRLTSSLKDRR